LFRKHALGTTFLIFVSVALRHFVENWLDRRVSFEHGRSHGIAKFLVRLPQFFVCGVYRRILHRYPVRGLQLLPLIPRKIREPFVAMPSPAFALRFGVFAIENGSKLHCRRYHDREKQLCFHVVK